MNKCEKCNNKTAYKTHHDAIRWALIRSRATGNPLRVYQCPLRHGFHLTSRVDMAVTV